MNIKYIIFDYGGTIDTNGIHWGTLIWYFYRRNDLGISEHEFHDAYVYAERALGSHKIISPTDTFRKTLTTKVTLQLDWLHDHNFLHLTPAEQKVKRQKIVESLYGFARHTVTSNASVLKILKSNGYHLALVSNFYGNINTVLEEMGIADMFETVVESADVHIRKPDPAIYALAAERLGVEDANTVMVAGDSLEKDIIPATCLGFKTAWIRDQRTAACVSLFGKKYDSKELAIPTVTISKLSQLIEFIENNSK